MEFRVDLHSHTVASDHAFSTLAEYASQAAARGLCMFATTDHGPALEDSPHPWHFANLRIVPRVMEGVAILRGAEANINDDGSIDLEPWALSALDIVLAGFHHIEPRDAAANTWEFKQAMSSGCVDIITHPGNLRYPIDHEEFLLSARDNGVAVEINGSSSVYSRLNSHDNCVALMRLARKIGNVIALGSDAHIATYLGNFDECKRVMQEAGIGADQILNESPIKVLDFLSGRGHTGLDDLYRHVS